MQEDPIGLAGGLNLYGYAAGDPINNSDPFGLDCEKRAKQGEKCDKDRGADGKEERHGACEVADILIAYADAIRVTPRRFATVRAFPGEFDWKYGSTADDLFQVGERWLRADEFGNFAAGYAAQTARGGLGRLAVILGGVGFASVPGSGEHWTDSGSRPMINAGAARARQDQLAGGTGATGMTTLTAPAGCGASDR